MSENNTSSANSFQFSLRVLLGITAFFAVTFVSLKHAGTVWWLILSSVSLVLFMGIAIVAFVGNGKSRAQAIGFVTCAVVYAILLLISQADELDPYEGQLPTTAAMLPVFQAISTGDYIDVTTGKVVPNYTPPVSGLGGGYGGGGYGGRLGGGGGGGGFFTVGFQEMPDRAMFMRVAHLLFVLILGAIGSFFAGFIYTRDQRQQG